MTATTEIRTTDRKTAAAEKRAKMLALGYHQSPDTTWCGLCRQNIVTGQYVRQMPSSWQRANPGLSAAVHYRCFDRLTA